MYGHGMKNLVQCSFDIIVLTFRTVIGGILHYVTSQFFEPMVIPYGAYLPVIPVIRRE